MQDKASEPAVEEVIPEIVPIPGDFYHLTMRMMVHYESDEITVLPKFFEETEPELVATGWSLKGDDRMWRFVLREDVREWLAKTIGPYSDGEYFATKFDNTIAIQFKSHRHAVAFKMTWL